MCAAQFITFTLMLGNCSVVCAICPQGYHTDIIIRVFFSVPVDPAHPRTTKDTIQLGQVALLMTTTLTFISESSLF